MHTLRYKLNKKEQSDLFIKLAKSMAQLRNSEEVAQFLKDLLSEVEVLMLARRLQIAELLIKGFTYKQIIEDMKVSKNTIARVQTWLDIYGEGYRTVIARSNKKEATMDYSKPFGKLKKKYPMYFWPEILLDEIIKTANNREKEKLRKVVEQLKDKSKLSHEINELLKGSQ